MREFDIFRNTDDMTVEIIAGSYPVLTDEEKERMFAMSERKFNIKERKYPQDYKNDTDEEYDDDEVEGVEEYDRPMWLKFVSTAAALMLVGGGLAVGRNLLRRRPVPDNHTPPNIATAVSTGSATTIVSGGNNITYTIDVDGMIAGIETTTTAAETAATNAAPAATQAPAAPAPTEAVTEPPTAAYDEAEYQQVVKDLTAKVIPIWEITSDMEHSYYNPDTSDIITVNFVDPETGSTFEQQYIGLVHPLIKSVDDMWALAKEVYTDSYAEWYYQNVFKSSEIYPGKMMSDSECGGYGVYEGRLYCCYYPDYQTDPWINDHYEEPVEKALISSVTENSFHAVIPVHVIRNSGEEYTFMNDIYVVKENGKWEIDGNGFPSADDLTGMTYDEYLKTIDT